MLKIRQMCFPDLVMRWSAFQSTRIGLLKTVDEDVLHDAALWPV